MLEAFELGTPPHGGHALGIDRLIMLLANEKSLKESIAFPMTGSGKTSVMDAPSPIEPEQLEELGLSVRSVAEEPVFDKVIKLLERSKADFNLLEHEPVKTSEEASKARGTKMSDAPKALILRKKSGDFLMVCIPADKKLDMGKVAEFVGEKVEMAKPEVIKERFGVEVGAVPPFGRLLGLDTYFDKAFWKNETAAFNAGRKDRSVVMKASDLLKLAEPSVNTPDLDLSK